MVQRSQIETAYSWHLSFSGYFKSVGGNDESAGEGEGGDWDDVMVDGKTQLAASYNTLKIKYLSNILFHFNYLLF